MYHFKKLVDYIVESLVVAKAELVKQPDNYKERAIAGKFLFAVPKQQKNGTLTVATDPLKAKNQMDARRQKAKRENKISTIESRF